MQLKNPGSNKAPDPIGNAPRFGFDFPAHGFWNQRYLIQLFQQVKPLDLGKQDERTRINDNSQSDSAARRRACPISLSNSLKG